MEERIITRVDHIPTLPKRLALSERKRVAAYAAAHPLCERCLKEGRYTPVDEVHHILPISKGGDHRESNLMSLCQSCHTKIHIEMGDRK